MRRAAVVAVALVTASCAGVGSRPAASEGGPPLVVGAVYPLVFAAESVGGGFVDVESLTSPGVEPHDLELTASQVATLSEADLVVFLGGGFQPAVEDVLSGSDGARVLDVLAGESTGDPHVWLDPTLMSEIVAGVARRLSEIDPRDADVYRANAAQLERRLQELDREFRAGLASCRTREIVTSHDAFGYLAARYDLEQISISGIDPEAEPSPGRLAEVARFVERHDVDTIFFEELVSPDVAETLAQETGARTAMLSPLESQPRSGTYVDAMRANLDALRKALDCV
ncbi:MAG: metal ABC transporter substrate-binding protein [Actinomycetota bacterium]|nr:metal ABC transporter substrate-binding protein [Actinomycetota bacterium]